MRKFAILGLLSLLSNVCLAQNKDYGWWVKIHDWDWVSHWSAYMTFQPGAMGPLALPVPDNQNGRLDTTLSLLLAPETHFAKNDFTADLFTRINIPIKKTIAIQVWWAPIEYFKTDTVVRDFRAARTREATGFCTGDVYIGTLIPIVQNKKNWPDLLLGINLKTASGTGLPDARTTDSPGYFFDLSGGKDFKLTNILPACTFRAYASGGFYVYQTNRTDYFQNDAILFGGGLDINYKKWRYSLQIAGYSGYFNELDQPIVLRFELNYKLENVDFSLRVQEGNESYNFTSIRAGVKFNFKTP